MSEVTFPTRSLADQRKPHRYVPAASTDLRVTFARERRRARLLAFFRRHIVEQR